MFDHPMDRGDLLLGSIGTAVVVLMIMYVCRSVRRSIDRNSNRMRMLHEEGRGLSSRERISLAIEQSYPLCKSSAY